MPTFEAGDVVRVPFPYTDRDVRQRRPALVVSHDVVGNGRLYWVLMITSADHQRWPGDVVLGKRYAEAGLPAPSMVRTSKIATVEVTRMEAIGRLPSSFMEAVKAELEQVLGQG